GVWARRGLRRNGALAGAPPMTRGCRHSAVRRRETGPRRTAGRPVRCWVGILVLVCACAAIEPPAPPRGSASAERLAAARFDVGRRGHTLVEASRPKGARDGAHARKRRTLVTTVWFPRGALGPHPLVLYSHGYFATRRGGAYLAEWLASRGYVVAAPDHPLTRRSTAHGRTVGDVVHQ